MHYISNLLIWLPLPDVCKFLLEIFLLPEKASIKLWCLKSKGMIWYVRRVCQFHASTSLWSILRVSKLFSKRVWIVAGTVPFFKQSFSSLISKNLSRHIISSDVYKHMTWFFFRFESEGVLNSLEKIQIHCIEKGHSDSK